MVDEEAVWQEAETLPWPGQRRGPDGFARQVGAINASTEMTVRDYVIIEAGEVVEMRLNLASTTWSSTADPRNTEHRRRGAPGDDAVLGRELTVVLEADAAARADSVNSSLGGQLGRKLRQAGAGNGNAGAR